MGHFYFVRHGESLWNVENKICGKTDIDLNERGYEQARAAAKAILDQNLKIDVILSSPLKRALHTAEVISSVCDIPLQVEERLIEQDFGRFESTPRNGEEFRIAKTHFIDSFGDGETMLKTAHRIYSVLDEIVKDEDRVVLIAAHNGLARIIESYFRDMTNEEFASFGIANAEIRRYDF